MKRFGRRNLQALAAATILAGIGSWAALAQQPDADSPFASQTIDLGTVCSDVEKSAKWYQDVVGFSEQDGFDVPGDFAAKVGLTNKLPFHVRVLTLGKGETATKLKLMQFKTAPGARVDQSYIHATYGFRYLTIFVKDIQAAVDRAAKAGAKPIAEGTVGLPEGLPQGVFLAVFRDPDGNFVELVGPKAK